MDIFDEEIIRFWKALSANFVRCIMVGGYAVNLHGHQRFTAQTWTFKLMTQKKIEHYLEKHLWNMKWGTI